MELDQGREPHLDALDADALEGSGVVTVHLHRRAIRALDAIQALAGEAISWTGERRAICDAAIARSPVEPYSYKTAGEALTDLERAGLLLRVRQGRNVVYYPRTTAPDGTAFAIVDVDRPTGRDVIRAAGMHVRDGGAHHAAATNAAIESQGGPVSTGRSISSSSSSDAAATNAATLDPDAANGAAIEAAAANDEIRRGTAEGPHPEIVARLQSLDVDPVPDLVARIAELRPAESRWFWSKIEAWGQGKPTSYALLCVDSAIRENARPHLASAAQEPRSTPPRRPAVQLTRLALRAAQRALHGLEARIGGEA